MRKRRFLYFALACTLAALLYWSGPVRQAVQAGLFLCATSVIPSLFPFFVAATLLINLGFAEGLGHLLEGPMRTLFRVGGNGASALLLGLVGGYPVGARTAAELYEKKLCTRTEAERLLAFCNNCSPAFILSVLGYGVFQSARAGVWLYLIHVAAALLTGLLFRRRGGGKPSPRQSAVPIRTVPLSAAFVQAVQAGLSAMLGVCAFVVLFMVVLQPLRAVPGLWGTVLTGVVELFNGAARLPASPAGFVAAAGLLGWGGLSVHCQTLSLLSGTGLSMRPYFLGKAIQGILSALIAFALVAMAY